MTGSVTDDSPTGAPPERDVEVDGTSPVSRPRLLVQSQSRDTGPRVNCRHPSGEVIVTISVDEDGASADYEGADK